MSRLRFLAWTLATILVTSCSQVALGMGGGCLTFAVRSLREELKAEYIVIVHQPDVDDVRKRTPGRVTMIVKEILKGADNTVRLGMKVEVETYAELRGDKLLCLVGNKDAHNRVQYDDVAIGDRQIEYARQILKLPDDPAVYRPFFLKWLDEKETFISGDVELEFTNLEHADFVAIKPHFDREQLLRHIEDETLAPRRRRLYVRMLGACGKPEDVAALKRLLAKGDVRDAITSYYLLRSLVALDWRAAMPVLRSHMTDEKRGYGEFYAAYTALKFARDELTTVPHKEITPAIHSGLEHAAFADIVILDLARTRDWSQVDRIAELFNYQGEEATYLKIPAVLYLLKCPLPAAKDHLTELERLDPAGVTSAREIYEDTWWVRRDWDVSDSDS